MNQEAALEWLGRSKGWLDLAKMGKVSENVRWEQLCYLCHQSAENSLKALCKLQGISLQNLNKGRDGHDLKLLVKRIEEKGTIVPEECKNGILLYPVVLFPFKFDFNLGNSKSLELGSLTKAVNGRYPDTKYQPVDQRDYDCARIMADNVLNWVEQQFRDYQTLPFLGKDSTGKTA